MSKNSCIFCNMDAFDIQAENDYAYVINDEFPITEMHALIIPKRHVKTYFDLNADELGACHDLLNSMRAGILDEDSSVEGFNIGMNNGTVAGQTIDHCHIHLIPRREGDVINATGGVRNIIPGMGDYLKDA